MSLAVDKPILCFEFTMKAEWIVNTVEIGPYDREHSCSWIQGGSHASQNGRNSLL
jgi:hypothetical protein